MMMSAEEGGADAEGRHQFFNKPLVIKTAQNTPAEKEVYNAASSFLRHPSVCLSITLFAKTQLTNAQYNIQQSWTKQEVVMKMSILDFYAAADDYNHA